MRFLCLSAIWLTSVSAFLSNDSSDQILTGFIPPPFFKNVNLVHTINLEKSYVRNTINVVVENIDHGLQTEYFVPFASEIVGKVGGFEVRDKKEPEKGPLKSELVPYDPTSSFQFYRVLILPPLRPGTQRTLTISYNTISILEPVPATIEQDGRQSLKYAFSTYSATPYDTDKQKTKIKFPSVLISESSGEPEKQGTTYTYGPYENIPARSHQAAYVRYEFNKPLIHASSLERDLEVSHWGGNLATEERYKLVNQAAGIKGQFNRVKWATTQHYGAPTTAIRELKVPLMIGSLDPYFTDDIGNISTSRFRSNRKECLLELKPRYPIFGNWQFPFRVGWDGNLKYFLRRTTGNSYILKVPFLEGPNMPEGISYEKVTLRVILPEGATNVKFQTAVPLVANGESFHKTFLDTLGRTTLTLTAMNVIDDARDQELLVTYDYTSSAGLRKPLTIVAGVFSVFVTAWVVGSLNMRIGGKA